MASKRGARQASISRRGFAITAARAVGVAVAGWVQIRLEDVLDSGLRPTERIPQPEVNATMIYRVQDVSAATLSTLYAPRPKSPIGFLLHTTDGRNSLAWLQGASAAAGKPASADFLITRLGKILRLVPRGAHSYHAGVCRWGGRIDGANEVSRLFVGIEVENADSAGEEPTEMQHRAVAALLLAAASKYGWSPLRGFGHYGLAYPMGRRSDPHAWDWGYMAWLMAHAQTSLTLTGDAAF